MKSYTDIEQSHKLAEFLPLDSADGFWEYHDKWYSEGEEWEGYEDYPRAEPYLEYTRNDNEWKEDKSDVPCWSLAALLGVMPKDKSIECSISFGYYSSKGEYIEKWLCAFEKEGETTDDFIIETFDGDNPIDACVAMILKLKEMNLI